MNRNDTNESLTKLEAISRILPSHLNPMKASLVSLKETLDTLIARTDFENAAVSEQHYVSYFNDARRCTTEALQLAIRELHGFSHVLNQMLEAQVDCYRITFANAEAISQCLSLSAEQTACSMLQRTCPRAVSQSFFQKGSNSTMQSWAPTQITKLSVQSLDSLGTPLPASLDLRMHPATGTRGLEGTLNSGSLPSLNSATSKRGTISSIIGTRKNRTSKIKSGRIISQPSIVSSTNGIANSLNALNRDASPRDKLSNAFLNSGSSCHPSTDSLNELQSSNFGSAAMSEPEAANSLKATDSNKPRTKSPLAKTFFGNSATNSNESLPLQSPSLQSVASPPAPPPLFANSQSQSSEVNMRLIADFVAADSNELSCRENNIVRVLSNDPGNGWTFCETMDSLRQGLVPTSYLRPTP